MLAAHTHSSQIAIRKVLHFITLDWRPGARAFSLLKDELEDNSGAFTRSNVRGH